MISSALLIPIFNSMFVKKDKAKSQPNLKVNFAFRQKYPKARSIKWEQMDVFKWQVSFKFKGTVCWTLFTSDGIWLETMHTVSLQDIPKMIQETYALQYDANDLQHIYKIQTSLRTIFEIQRRNGLHDLKLLYDQKGKLLGKMIG